MDLKTKSGDTPLMMAIEFGRLEIFEYLVHRGAHLEEVDTSGYTALWRAVKEKAVRMAT